MLGYFLSVYCLYKMVIATVNIIFDRDPTKDPVTRGFEVREHLVTVVVRLLSLTAWWW